MFCNTDNSMILMCTKPVLARVFRTDVGWWRWMIYFTSFNIVCERVHSMQTQKVFWSTISFYFPFFHLYRVYINFSEASSHHILSFEFLACFYFVSSSDLLCLIFDLKHPLLLLTFFSQLRLLQRSCSQALGFSPISCGISVASWLLIYPTQFRCPLSKSSLYSVISVLSIFSGIFHTFGMNINTYLPMLLAWLHMSIADSIFCIRSLWL